MKKISLVYLVTVLFIIFWTNNLLSQSIENIEIEPPNPTIYDSINIVIWGWLYQTNNIIVDTTVYINPNFINLGLYWEDVGIGFPVVLPYNYSFPIGTLPSGDYYALCESYFLQSYWYDDTTFTVTPGTYIDNNVNMLTCSELLINYPNPFNTFTTISFLTTKPTKPIVIVIYNIKGQLVKELIPDLIGDRSEGLGVAEAEWDGTDKNGKPVPGGIYLYKLEIDGKTKVIQKMLVLR